MPPPRSSAPAGGDDMFSHPALHPSITSIPVTPGVTTTGQSSYFQSSTPPTVNTEGPHWNANSYFAARETEPTDSSSGHPPDSPTKVAEGARSGAELLRRLSLVDGSRPETAELDPRAAHPALNLTGGLISATFCIPHALEYRSGADWVSGPQLSRRSPLISIDSQIQAWYLGALRFLLSPLLLSNALEPYVGWLDGRDQASF